MFENISWSLNQIFFKYIISKRFKQFSTLKNDFENQNFGIFDKVFYNFGMN